MLLHEEAEEAAEAEDEEDEESVKVMFTCISYLMRYFHLIFCMQLFFSCSPP